MKGARPGELDFGGERGPHGSAASGVVLHADPGAVPSWLQPVLEVARTAQVGDFTPLVPPAEGGRPGAILMLFWAEDPGDPQVLLIERARDLRSHAGQPAFPGGALEAKDSGPVAAALREAAEETGLDPTGVEVLATLPDLWVPVSGFVVTPVLAWWRRPSPVRAADPVEIAAVHRVRVADLIAPQNRLIVRHPPTGRTSPGFEVNGILVWGFTAAVLDRLLRYAGWERPWPSERVEDLPAELLLPPRTAPVDPVEGRP